MRARSLLCAAILAMFAAPALAAPQLVAHRAVYDLALEKASDRSGIVGLTGRMVYEFEGSPCEGYTSTFRFVTRIATEDNSRLSDQQTTSFEDAEGKSFSFATKSFADQALEKEVRGNARSGKDGIEVSLQKPEAGEVSLPPALFPTAHMIDLIDRAARGETFYSTHIFDGSEDGDKAMTTTVVVGKKRQGSDTDPEAAALGKVKDEAYWPVDMAYFDEAESDGEEVPDYHTSFKLHASGITRDLVMDYGDFSMTGRLVDLAVYDTPQSCTAR